MANERPVILLAAHGERGGAARNERLAGLVEAVGKAIPEADVGALLVNVEGLAAKTLAACGGRPVLCLPMLFSDGWFYQQLAPHFDGQARRLAQPLAFWPGFAPLLADNLALRLIARSADPRVILIAHGSTKGGKSAAAAREVASRLAGRYGSVETAFLEEAPFARDAVAKAQPPYSLIGLFFGEGMHGSEDFDLLVSEAPTTPAAAFTVGELPGLMQLVIDEAQQRLSELARG